MGKMILIEFRKMRHYPLIWGILLFALGESVYYAYDGSLDDFFLYNPGLEYIILLCRTARSSVILTTLTAAYVSSEDFSMRTVQNVFAVGVDRGRYFFARLSFLVLFTVALTGVRYFVYIAARILFNGKAETALSAGEFLAAFVVMTLQLAACAAVIGVVSMLFRSQAAAVMTGEIWLFLSLALRLYMGIDLSSENPTASFGPLAYEPMTVLERTAADFLVPGRIYSLDFLRCGMAALLLILASAAAGYGYLCRADIQ